MKSIIHNLIIFFRINQNIFLDSGRVPSLLKATLLVFALTLTFPTLALSPDFYATSSKLASGHWAKVEVKVTGMQLISNSTLKSLGFSDPSKVNVYGTGGRMLSERLDDTMADDLPILPSIQTKDGILFFGHNNISWSNSAQNPIHKINPYSSSSYYFISDCTEPLRSPQPAEEVTPYSAQPITTFIERLAHEEDIIAPSNSGRTLLGEDFRRQPSQTFKFPLTGIVGEPIVKICFATNVSNGKSSLEVSLNGAKQETKTINGISSSETFMTRQTFAFTGTIADNLDVNIKHSNTGVAKLAALDYIEVLYPRSLQLENNELYFYLQVSTPSPVQVEGCNADTQIWDVTNASCPKKVNFDLDGTIARFAMPAGFHEYVAFNPAVPAAVATAAGVIANQDLHAMDIPDMLIITPSAFRQAALKVAAIHEEADNMKCAVLTPEEIYNEFSSGTPDVTAFRRLLKMWYDRATASGIPHTRYCLLMSRPTYDHKMVTSTVKREGIPHIPIWQSESGYSETTSYSTDDYIGMLDDNAKDLSMGSARIHVAVGRMPVKTLSEALTAAEKLEKYIVSPNLSAWRNNIMVIADDQDNGDHLTQAEKVIDILSTTGKGGDYHYEKLYLDSYQLQYSGTGAVYPQAKARMLDKWNEGVIWINYIGHANPKSWSHENLFTWNDITSMKNPNLPFLYAATCEFMRWDADEVSGAEELWLNPSSGIIGTICPSRTVYISLNGTLNTSTSRYLFGKDNSGNPLRLGDVMVNGKNGLTSDTNKLRYGFCGDPALRLPTPSLDVTVDRINDAETSDTENTIVLEARSKVRIEGSITDADGNTVDDFNGLAELNIYDAEKVIGTWGNGADGKVMHYNDRKTRLYNGRVEVTNGKWATTAFIPSEILNLYNTALISLYAASSDGKEANGAFDSFYIFGFDNTADEDNEGPAVSDFYLDSPAFTDGMSVAPSTTLKATFSDPSGINVSDGGIGHGMVLTLDDKTHFTNLQQFYTPSHSDPTGGSLTYPLSGIEPGQHTLTLTLWDNANNSSTHTLTFNVSANWKPSITTLYADAYPAVSSVNFIVATDGTRGEMKCQVDVVDLSGRKVWTSAGADITDASTMVRIPWNLHGDDGVRVARGIYIYRATITGKDGMTLTKSKKIAVAAP